MGSVRKRASAPKAAATVPASATLLADIVHWLDEAKAEEIVEIPLQDKSSLGDYMVIASGRTDRHVGAIAYQLATKLKAAGVSHVRLEIRYTCDWFRVESAIQSAVVFCRCEEHALQC